MTATAREVADGLMDEFVVLDDYRDWRDFILEVQFRDAIEATLNARYREGLEAAAKVADANASALLTEIIDFFAYAEETPGSDWAHDDDYQSYALDHRSKDGTKFWLDLNKDGIVDIVWKPVGGPLSRISFVAAIRALAPAKEGE